MAQKEPAEMNEAKKVAKKKIDENKDRLNARKIRKKHHKCKFNIILSKII